MMSLLARADSNVWEFSLLNIKKKIFIITKLSFDIFLLLKVPSYFQCSLMCQTVEITIKSGCAFNKLSVLYYLGDFFFFQPAVIHMNMAT